MLYGRRTDQRHPLFLSVPLFIGTLGLRFTSGPHFAPRCRNLRRLATYVKSALTLSMGGDGHPGGG
jgi:hypothetical protein